MTFAVGDGFFDGGFCLGFVVCRGKAREGCTTFPCPPYDGVYAGWWTDGCSKSPDSAFRLSFYTGTRWELLGEYDPGVHPGYVSVRWEFTERNCGYAYKVEFDGDVRYFLVGDVPSYKVPCRLWTKDMLKAEKDEINEFIKAEKADASADVKDLRASASAEVKVIRGKATIDIAAERAEYKISSTDIRGRVKRELVDIRDTHNEREALLKAEYKTAKTLSDDEERQEKIDVRSDGKIEISDEKRKEIDDIGNIRKQRDLDVAAEYRGRDDDIRGRYEARDRKVQEIKDAGSPCLVR